MSNDFLFISCANGSEQLLAEECIRICGADQGVEAGRGEPGRLVPDDEHGRAGQVDVGDVRLALLVGSDDRGAPGPGPADHVRVAGGPDHGHGEQGARGGAD